MIPSLSTLPNLEDLTLETSPWVNIKYISTRFFDDRLLDEIDYRREGFEFNEEETVVADTAFSYCQSLNSVNIKNDEHWSENKYTATRKGDGSVDRLERTVIEASLGSEG
jgi:hypothetical protein